MPHTVQTSATARLDITADTLRLGTNGAFEDATFLKTVTAGSADKFDVQTFGGYVTMSGTTVSFLVQGDLYARGTLEGSTLTITGNGSKSIYTR